VAKFLSRMNFYSWDITPGRQNSRLVMGTWPQLSIEPGDATSLWLCPGWARHAPSTPTLPSTSTPTPRSVSARLFPFPSEVWEICWCCWALPHTPNDFIPTRRSHGPRLFFCKPCQVKIVGHVAHKIRKNAFSERLLQIKWGEKPYHAR